MDDRLTEPPTQYQRALSALFERTGGGSKFGLERTEALLATLGNPHRTLRTFHVAGTNGKGSVCAMLEALLRYGGLRVGKYTSPHLVDFRERLLIDGAPVSQDYVIDFIDRTATAVDRIGATFFEATTAMAFAWFAESSVDAAVIETGLGGRLDSTNVVTPEAAGVTSIGIDHVEFLGNRREQIAAEKAGIFKRGVPAVIGEQDDYVADLLEEHAQSRGASPIARVWRDAPPAAVRVDAGGTSFDWVIDGATIRLRTSLTGAHQASNTAVALLMTQLSGPAFQLPAGALQAALGAVHLPGRFQKSGRYIFDVAHNPDGAGVLADTLSAVGAPRPVVALLAVLADKDWRGVMRALAGHVDAFVLTNAPTAPASRAWNVDDAESFARDQGWSSVLEPDFDKAIALAGSLAATVLVTGSFHTVGDAMVRLQVDPLAR